MSILVGKQAPDFQTAAVLPNGDIVEQLNLHDTLKGKLGLIFFYPLDFTFVCPSELIALDNRVAQFKEKGVEVIAVSVDSIYTHMAWRQTPLDKGGIGQVRYTLAADVSHKICQAYGIEHPEAGVAFRAAFLIDQNLVVRSQIVNDLPIGRNIDEILRIFDAIAHHEEYGEVCPANWQKGGLAMTATSSGVADYLGTHAKNL